MHRKNQLILSAIELVKLGKRLEKSRSTLASLVNAGVPYDSEKMRNALDECLALDAQWKAAEQRHLALKQALER